MRLAAVPFSPLQRQTSLHKFFVVAFKLATLSPAVKTDYVVTTHLSLNKDFYFVEK